MYETKDYKILLIWDKQISWPLTKDLELGRKSERDPEGVDGGQRRSKSEEGPRANPDLRLVGGPVDERFAEREEAASGKAKDYENPIQAPRYTFSQSISTRPETIVATP
ncbi:MAG: hypothetical protein Q9219_003708 [cf. Caloplaca sp. 3 TL-2023]